MGGGGGRCVRSDLLSLPRKLQMANIERYPFKAKKKKNKWGGRGAKLQVWFAADEASCRPAGSRRQPLHQQAEGKIGFPAPQLLGSGSLLRRPAYTERRQRRRPRGPRRPRARFPPGPGVVQRPHAWAPALLSPPGSGRRRPR